VCVSVLRLSLYVLCCVCGTISLVAIKRCEGRKRLKENFMKGATARHHHHLPQLRLCCVSRAVYAYNLGRSSFLSISFSSSSFGFCFSHVKVSFSLSPSSLSRSVYVFRMETSADASSSSSHTHTNVSFSLFHCFSYSSFSFLSTWCSGKQSAMKQSCKADNTHFRAASAAAATSVFFFLSNSFKKIFKNFF
jgi:hypothetical protein